MSEFAIRNALVATVVLSAHLALIWLLLGREAPQPGPNVLPVDIVVELITPLPQPIEPAPARPVPRPPAIAASTQDTRSSASSPLEPTHAAPARTPEPTPFPDARTEPQAPSASVSEVAAPPLAPERSPPPQAALLSQAYSPPQLQLPSTQAGYLNNPKPPYPPLSKRLGEQGKVVVRVLIEPDGTASRAEVHSSSGFERLDRTALQTVQRWRYAPGTRNGVPEAMWFNVPIQFVLE
jgi:periplasmic protein TonB